MVNVSTQTMDALKALGLNLYERRIWVALLAKGTATAGELASIANVPRSRAYDILESLAQKGLVIMQPTKPVKYVAIEPSEALERLKKNLELKLKEFEKRIEDIKRSKVMEELNALYAKSLKTIEPKELTGTLRGKTIVNRHLSTILKNANKKVKIITTADGARDILDYHLETLKQLKKKGADIKIALVDKVSKDVLNQLSKIAKVKVLKERPIYTNLFLIDDNVIFNITEPKQTDPSQEVSIWSKSRHAATNVFEPIFDMIWKK